MTMDGKNKTGQDALPSQGGQPSPSGVSSPSGPTSYTAEQVENLIKERHSTLDKEISSLGKQLKESLATVAAKESELADIVAERESLEKQIEDLSSDDPDRFSLVREQKTLRERERKYQADLKALGVDKQAHQEIVKLATDTLREISIWEIAGEYETGDPVKLKDLCDTFTATSEEQMRKVADTLWTKKKSELVTPLTSSIRLDSGLTSGGAEKDLSTIRFGAGAPSASEMIDKGLQKLKK